MNFLHKTNFISLGLIILLMWSCKKKDFCEDINTAAPAIEVNALKDYLTTNGISATEDSRGFFYIIRNAGTDEKPTICSRVTVQYAGRLVDGTLFDTTSSATFLLSDLISGWQEGIPLIKKGGSITLYLPPTLGYGSATHGSIPGSSILIFNLDLKEVE